jgi:cytochrome c oxidase cbb3-type subunit 4
MLITFIALFVWVLLPKNQKGYNEASKIPFEEDEADAEPTESKTLNNDRRETP